MATTLPSPRQAFTAVLTRYRNQRADLQAADDEGEVDRPSDASYATLRELSATRVFDAPALADKLQAVADWHKGDLVAPEFLHDALADAQALATEPGFALAWAHLWYDLGAWLAVNADGQRLYGQPEPLVVTDRYTGKLPPHLRLQDEAETVGASKALRIILKLAGKRAQDAVFAFGVPIAGAPAPKSWGRARDDWRAANAAVMAAELAGADEVKVERLDDARHAAEDALMATPSPDASAFALKYRIAKGSGRETDCWDKVLDAEALHFAGVEG